MELKIVCGCGQKYTFDVEPINVRMPVKVSCPSCGVHGTESANNILAQYFSSRPAPIPVVLSARPAMAPASPPSPPPIAAAIPVSRPLPLPSTPRTIAPETDVVSIYLDLFAAHIGGDWRMRWRCVWRRGCRPQLCGFSKDFKSSAEICLDRLDFSGCVHRVVGDCSHVHGDASRVGRPINRGAGKKKCCRATEAKEACSLSSY